VAWVSNDQIPLIPEAATNQEHSTLAGADFSKDFVLQVSESSTWKKQ
jgi:hypothetical protein